MPAAYFNPRSRYDDYYPPDPTDEVVEPLEDIHDLDLEADLVDREFEG